MDINTLTIWVVVAAFLGGIAAAFLGWAKQVPPTPWDGRSFVVSVVASIIGAAGVAAAFKYSGVTNFASAMIIAFLSGAGFTAGSSRVSGAVAARFHKMLKNLPKS